MTAQQWAEESGILGELLEGLPGREQWGRYLENLPSDWTAFLTHPVQSFLSLLPQEMETTLQREVENYTKLFFFLLLALVLSLLLPAGGQRDLLELLTAGGCCILTGSVLSPLTETVCQSIREWRIFLNGFLPVVSGVLLMGGETGGAAISSGVLLTGLCGLAGWIEVWMPDFLRLYLALSMACCIREGTELSAMCRMLGNLLRKGIEKTGKVFSVLMGMQRVFSIETDRTARLAGQALTGAVPIVGDSLNTASSAVLAGVRLLKSRLGLGAILALTAVFLPLYLRLLLHLLVLSVCTLFCGLLGNGRVSKLFRSFREMLRIMLATTIMLYEIDIIGTLLITFLGGN